MMIVYKQNLRALTKEMFLNLMNEKGLAALEIIRNFNKKERQKIMNTYLITNNKNSDSYREDFLTMSEAKHWTINHLDLSNEWTIKEWINENERGKNDKTNNKIIKS
jgi:hypothetical protein